MASSYKTATGNQSFKTQWQVAVTRSGLGLACIGVLSGLSTWMDQHGRSCYPTIDLIADEMAVCEKTIRRHLNQATKKGYLKRCKHSRKGKKGWNYSYIATIPDQHEPI